MYGVIAVTQRVSKHRNGTEIRDGLDHKMNLWLADVGCLPMPVPNNLKNHLFDWLTIVKPIGILLTGGEDIGDCKDRDRTEKELLGYAAKNRLPVLGLCRGMQMLSVYSGGQLRELSGHVSVTHPIQGELVEKNKLPAMVNSFHNWTLNSCPNEYFVTATDLNGNIEAIAHRTLPWEGWMWHPERAKNFGEIELQRAQKLFLGD